MAQDEHVDENDETTAEKGEGAAATTGTASNDAAAKDRSGEVDAWIEDLDQLVDDLAGSNRRRRQDASQAFALIAHARPEALVGSTDALIDALFRPEAQTRWESLDALTQLVGIAPAEKVSSGAEGAEASLFDEGSPTVRLAAFRFLTTLGATTPELSDEVWPLLDEAVQCFHGDPEYRDMLTGLLDFARGDISETSRDALVERIGFDARSGRGYIRTCSTEIIEAASGASK